MPLTKLKASKAVRPGDIFVVQLVQEPECFRFGRVIATDVGVVPWEGCFLVYFFRGLKRAKDDFPDMSPGNRMFPPMLVNEHLCEDGYFEIVASPGLEYGIYPPIHFFEDDRGRYYDQTGREIFGPVPMQQQSAISRFLEILSWWFLGRAGHDFPRLTRPVCDPSLMTLAGIENLLDEVHGSTNRKKAAN